MMRAQLAGVVANSEFVTFCSESSRSDTWTKKRVAEVDPCQEEKQCLTSFWIQSHDLQNESPTLYHSSWKLHFEQNLTKGSQGQKFNLFWKLMSKTELISSLWQTINRLKSLVQFFFHGGGRKKILWTRFKRIGYQKRNGCIPRKSDSSNDHFLFIECRLLEC